MKSRNQLLYTIVGFFVIFGLVISMNSKTAFAEDGKVFYLDDLKKGDFIPNNSTIIIGKSYVNSSDNVSPKIDIYISSYSNDAEEKILFDPGSTFLLQDYFSYFSDISYEFDGWVVSNTRSFNNYEVYLAPANLDDVDNDNNIIFDENNNEVKLLCKDNIEASYNWYKIKTFDGNVEFNSPLLEEWNYENGIYSYSLDDYYSLENLKSEIKINVNGNKNDLLSFNFKTIIGGKYIFNGVSGTLNNLDKNSYQNEKIILTKTGNNELVLTELMTVARNGVYYSDYFYLKDIMLLTPLNEGSKLDTSKVSNGDEIYYECKCGEGYKYSNSFKYVSDEPIVEKEASNDIIDKDNSVDKNPSTYSNIIVIIFVVSIILFSTYINRGKLFRKDS